MIYEQQFFLSKVKDSPHSFFGINYDSAEAWESWKRSLGGAFFKTGPLENFSSAEINSSLWQESDPFAK